MASKYPRVISLPVPEQRYSCHSCAGCCRDFTVELAEHDIERLRKQDYPETLGEEPWVEFRGKIYLRQGEDGACVFLQDDGLCRIHADYGFTEKPIACQLFPFTVMPARGGVQMGLSFACPSVINNRGDSLTSHLNEVRRMASAIPEARARVGHPRLNDTLEAEGHEARFIEEAFDHWMQRVDLTMDMRLDGAALVTSMLRDAQLEKVRAGKLKDLLDVLFEAMPEETALRPVADPSTRQHRLLRQIAFAHCESPKISEMVNQSVFRKGLHQLWLNRRFGKGRGVVPAIQGDWPEETRFEQVEAVGPAENLDDVRAIDFLLMRYVRARILGGRAWGSGYYGWPVIHGLEALWIMLAATGWLARLHAAGNGRDRLTPADVEAAMMKADRNAGRALWLGTRPERLRLNYLALDEGIRRLRQFYRLTDEGEGG